MWKHTNVKKSIDGRKLANRTGVQCELPANVLAGTPIICVDGRNDIWNPPPAEIVHL